MEFELKRFVLNPLLRVAVLLLMAPILIFRVYNIIPMIAGIILIGKDPKRYGRMTGWLLVVASFAATLIYYLAYSVEGGIFY